MIYEVDGKLLTAANGDPAQCCCPEAAAPPSSKCCVNGNVQTLFFYGYFWLNASYGCLPLQFTDTTSGDVYFTFGTFSGGAVQWNGDTFTIAGSIGCVDVTLHGVCTHTVDMAHHLVHDLYSITTTYDFGGGHTFSRAINNRTSCVPTDQIDGSGNTIENCLCIADTGCVQVTSDVSGGVYISETADIVTPTGDTIPETITFNVSLTDAGGTPTLYSCSLRFSPNFSSAGGSTTCWTWSGYLVDCTGHTTAVSVYYGTDLLWHVAAFAHTGIFDSIDVYDGASFPTAGVSTGDWRPCGASLNFTPMWSVTT